MGIYISLNSDEIRREIPYAIVAETMSSARWNTGKRKMLMRQQFTEAEVEATYRLHKQAYDWHLRKGVPEEIKISLNTYYLWRKLANFCCEI